MGFRGGWEERGLGFQGVSGKRKDGGVSLCALNVVGNTVRVLHVEFDPHKHPLLSGHTAENFFDVWSGRHAIAMTDSYPLVHWHSMRAVEEQTKLHLA